MRLGPESFLSFQCTSANQNALVSLLPFPFQMFIDAWTSHKCSVPVTLLYSSVFLYSLVLFEQDNIVAHLLASSTDNMNYCSNLPANDYFYVFPGFRWCVLQSAALYIQISAFYDKVKHFQSFHGNWKCNQYKQLYSQKMYIPYAQILMTCWWCLNMANSVFISNDSICWYSDVHFSWYIHIVHIYKNYIFYDLVCCMMTDLYWFDDNLFSTKSIKLAF